MKEHLCWIFTRSFEAVLTSKSVTARLWLAITRGKTIIKQTELWKMRYGGHMFKEAEGGWVRGGFCSKFEIGNPNSPVNNDAPALKGNGRKHRAKERQEPQLWSSAARAPLGLEHRLLLNFLITRL